MATLMLIDGNSLMNRAYYGLAGRARLTSPEGVPTGALLSFLNMLLMYRDQVNPTMIAVAFDRPEPTFRHLQYEDYKAKRSAMPDDLVIQMSWIKKILDAMKVARFEKPGYEADDLIGTLAQRAACAGTDVVIVSGDKDTLQLIDSATKVILPVTRAAGSARDTYDRQAFIDRYGIEPHQFVDVKALMGDQSDNIPGVRGIGEKGALSLISTYGSLDGIYANLDHLTKRQRELLVAGKDDAYRSQKLSVICRDVEIDVDEEALLITEPGDEVRGMLLSLGMRQLLSRLGLGEAAADETKIMLDRLGDPVSAGRLLAATKGGSWLSLSFQEDGSVCFYREGLGHAIGEMELLEQIGREETVYVWDYKALLHISGVQKIEADVVDLLIVQSLLEPSSSAVTLEATYGRVSDTPLPEVKSENDRLVVAAIALARMAKPLLAKLEDEDMTDVFESIEKPLTPVLAQMEKAGILVDKERLDELTVRMAADIDRLEEEIFAESGRRFNLNSPKQLAEVLFADLKLPPGRKSASGQYSTSADELDRLEPDYPLVGKIKEHRFLSKLHGTFLTGLAKEIAEDGRIHTTYLQVSTATGRLASVKPNLQNIPVRTARGREIREIFIAKPGYVLLDADYAQIELRILAHLADDKKLKEAFAGGVDVHALTASNMFHVPIDSVTPEMRDVAKTVNFSIVYGVGDFGLAKSLGTSVTEARAYIENYNRLYHDVRAFLDKQIENAYKDGYVSTLSGRRRYMHELKSSNRNQRQFGERAAMNAPVQGTAADLIKLAMIAVDRVFKEEGVDAKLLLQVHDELIVEVKESDRERAAALLIRAMEGAMSLDVSLDADVNVGKSWAEAKS